MTGNAAYPEADLAIIVAMDRKGTIGRDNHLPWHITEDLAYFRSKTLDHNVVMGKNTWRSLGKPLDRRTNIVLTHDPDFTIPGLVTCRSVDEVMEFVRSQKTFVIGGASVFGQFLPIVRSMLITRIDAEYEGDVRFPPYDESGWELLSFETRLSEAGITLSFNEYVRNRGI